MAIIRLTNATWIARETERIKGILLAQLPRAGLPAAEVRQILAGLGFNHSDAEYQAIAAALVADGTIEIV